jgi:hypothetical protein
MPAEPIGGPIGARIGPTGLTQFDPDAWSLTDADRIFLKRTGVMDDERERARRILIHCLEALLKIE